MALPGFTATDALYRSTRTYRQTAHTPATPRSDTRRPPPRIRLLAEARRQLPPPHRLHQIRATHRSDLRLRN